MARTEEKLLKKDNKALGIDYAQVEKWILALLKKSEGVDLYAELAKKMFTTKNPTKEQRSAAKEVSFRSMYGGKHQYEVSQED